MKIVRGCLCLLIWLIPTPLLGHDTWLIPSSFRPPPGTPVTVRLATSEAFPSSEAATKPERVARFALRQGRTLRPVPDYRTEGEFLAARVTVADSEGAIVFAELHPRLIVLTPEQFEAYLREEHAERALAARRTADQGGTPGPDSIGAGRELYRKIAKTVLCPGESTRRSSAFSQAEGLWLEILLESDPCRLRTGDSLVMRVLFRGQPLEGAHVGAGHAGVRGHEYPVRAVTDANGRATLRLDRPGPWFLRTHHIVPLRGNPEADWESAFSSITFEVRENAQASHAEPRFLARCAGGRLEPRRPSFD